MTNLTLLSPACHSGHNVPFWPRPLTTESCRELRSPSSEAEMPNSGPATSLTTTVTANALRTKRSQSKEKTRKSTDEKPNQVNTQDHSGGNVKQEKATSRDQGRVPSTSHQSETVGSPSNATPSPSASPKSPSTSKQNRPPSSLSGTPPHPAFTPPTSLSPACFSPVPMGGLGATMPGLPSALGAMGLFNGAQNLPEGVRNLSNGMPRNCSDLMRSMAARYNNNNTGLNFYNNPSLNGLHRPPMPPVGFPSPGFIPGLPNESSPSPVQAGPARDTTSKTAESSVKRAAIGGLPPGLPHHLLSPGGFPGLQANPLMDLSSTQVLINMVRNASNLHQNQLQKSQNDVHSQHQLQKQLIYQQQLHQQQQHQQQQQQQHQQQQQLQEAQQQQQILQDRHKHMKQEETHQTATSPSHASEENQRSGVKRPAEAASPLDLSSPVLHKFPRPGSETDINVEDDGACSLPRASPEPEDYPMGIKTSSEDYQSMVIKSEIRPSPVPNKPSFEEKEDSLTWTVDDVYEFVKSIDICAEYAENFRDQRIDGACLSLLSESHLTGSLKMKLGPALKLRSFLASRAQQQLRPTHTVNHSYNPLSPSRSCNHCNNNNNNNNEHVIKKSSYSDASSVADQLSPRDQTSLLSPVHNQNLLSIHSQSHKENGGLALNTENRQPAGVD